MKYSIFAILIIFLTSMSSLAQDSTSYKWKELRKYQLDSNEVWALDGLQNVFISKGSIINKFDTAGVLKFSQSIKSLGKMQQLVPVNTMKLVHFSEEQQTLCYLDNTLTQNGDCIELADQGIVNASMIASSSRPEMIWVFDNLNSKLILLPLTDGQQQRQEIENLMGVLDINSVSQIIERNSKLYLVKEGAGVYIFDLYGSLIEYREIPDVSYIDVYKNSIVAIADNSLKIINLDSGLTSEIVLPKDGILEFRYAASLFYARTSKYVHKFSLELTK